MKQAFRPTAIPLITSDPYFSVWSFTDRLYDDHTRHWTSRRQSMYGTLLIDGKPFRFMGLTKVFDISFPEGPSLEQTSVQITPTSTVYQFTHPLCDMKVTFLSPLLLNRPELVSRPVSYMFYEITPREEGHTFEVYVDLSAELAGDAIIGKDYTCYELPGHAYLGRTEQNVLNCCGDDVRIDWGYLHLVHPNAKISILSKRLQFNKKRTSAKFLVQENDKPIPCAKMPLLATTSTKLSDMLVFAYDDIKSIRFYDREIDAYYKTVYGDFDTMLAAAIKDVDEVRAACEKFDRELIAEMESISPEYAKIGALAYRQAIAAHKLIEVDGKMMFLSKECFSNGCLATLDVTYPSIPLFLYYNPEFVRAMMRPLFDFARRPEWDNEFAPHDCGRYPYCIGQVYGQREDGTIRPEKQMPIEECGNAILTVAAAVRADGDRSIAEENRDLLEKWANYLVKYGYDPENQLCTDDFAGHLAHNCNLSLKAIVALGAYAQLFDEPKYGEIAKDMATRWVKDAKKQNGKGWRLTFDQEDTWSLKYNIIWDRLLGLGLFDEAVSAEEVSLYAEKMNEYGIPLDSRADYTKIDWLAWTTVMTDNEAYTKAVYESMVRMMRDAEERVPLTDWYYTLDAKQADFQARSVLGGFYINLVAKKFLK